MRFETIDTLALCGALLLLFAGAGALLCPSSRFYVARKTPLDYRHVLEEAGQKRAQDLQEARAGSS